MSKQIVNDDSVLLLEDGIEEEEEDEEESEESEDETDEDELNEEKIHQGQKTDWTLDSNLEEWVSLLIKQPRILLYEKAKQLKINSQIVRLSKDELFRVNDYDWKNFVIRIAIILQLINSQQWLSLHKDQKLSQLIDSKIASHEKQKIAEEIVYNIHNNYPAILAEVNSFRQMGSWQLIQKLNSFDSKSDQDPTLNGLQDIIKKFRFLKNLRKNSDFDKAGDLIIKAKEELENHGIFQESFKADEDPFDHLMNLEMTLLHIKLCQNLKTLIQMAGILELGIDYHQINTSELAHKVIQKLKDLQTIKKRTYAIPVKMVELIKECILTERREKLSPSAAKIYIITKQLSLDPKDLNRYIKKIANNLITEKADIALLAEWLNINLNGHYLRKDKIIDLFIRSDLSLMDKFFTEDSDDSQVIVKKSNIKPHESKASLVKLRQSKEILERIKKKYSEDEIQDLIEDMDIEIPEDHNLESGYYLMQHIFKGMEFILKDPKELEVYLEHSVQKKIISNKSIYAADAEELYEDPDFFDSKAYRASGIGPNQ